MSNKNTITDMPYATWLEQVLHDILDLPIKGIAFTGILENGDIYVKYYNTSMADKLVISGIVNQDATIDMLAAQGIIEYEEEKDENEEVDCDGEEE